VTDFVAYHDRTSQDHQNQFNSLYPQGYRMISLSVYQPANPLYAAVWVRRPGPNWSAVHGVSAAGYQAAFDNATAAGLHPTIISAAGPASSAVFAGVFEQRPGPVPLTRHALRSGNNTDPATIENWDRVAHENGWIMTCGAVYGDVANPRYAGSWPANVRRLSWSADGILDRSAEHQRRFDAQVTGWARPAYVAVSGDERYLSIFVDDQIGPWVARHGLTSAQYQAEFDRLVPLGYYPICVQGGGSGAGIRFAVIFARQEAPLQRPVEHGGRRQCPRGRPGDARHAAGVQRPGRLAGGDAQHAPGVREGLHVGGARLSRFMLSPVRRALTSDRCGVSRSRRTAAVAAIGPLIVLAGVLWALAQPDRLLLLDPDAHSFWSLAVEPPLLVLLAGVFFRTFIASGLIRDLDRSEVG
jgi:hypothetical protein